MRRTLFGTNLKKRSRKTVYMDHAATTPVTQKVMEAMKPYFTSGYGNASSLHDSGQEARKAVEESRKTIASLINAGPDEVFFTSGGTEADNTAIKGIAFANRDKGNHIIITKIEHDAVIRACDYLEKNGFEVTRLDVDGNGLVDPEDVRKAITEKTILVSVMHANNEIGTIEPIGEIGKICREHDIYFHTDAVQTLGKIPIDVKKMDIDLLSASAHKIYGPKGVGCLYVRKGVGIEPLVHGGGHEHGMRSGTENVPGIVGFAKACELAGKSMRSESERLAKLRDMLINGILRIPGTRLNGHPEKRLPNNVNVSFRHIEGEGIVLRLNDRGIAASTGSACSSNTLEPSHVLLAIGLGHADAHGSLRLTLGKESSEEDVRYVLEVLLSVISGLREISPFKLKAGV
jgi:cysteine desulfurase